MNHVLEVMEVASARVQYTQFQREEKGGSSNSTWPPNCCCGYPTCVATCTCTHISSPGPAQIQCNTSKHGTHSCYYALFELGELISWPSPSNTCYADICEADVCQYQCFACNIISVCVMCSPWNISDLFQTFRNYSNCNSAKYLFCSWKDTLHTQQRQVQLHFQYQSRHIGTYRSNYGRAKMLFSWLYNGVWLEIITGL